MASLKNIMNTDDEHVDPRSGSRPIDLASRPSLRPNPSASGSTSSSSHNSRPDPPTSSTTSSVVDHLSSSSTNRNMTSRRRSNTSLDSLELSNQPGPSSNAPMRPFTAGVGNEPHVKLTPITRKISKAKKGVPVHTCDRCPKTFSRAEHLRRHQLSHSPPDLCCQVPGCNKTFYRKDLLDRHIQRHEQEKGAKDPKPPASRRNSKTSTQTCPNMTQETGLKMPDNLNGPRMGAMAGSTNNSTMVSGSWTSMPAAPSVSQSYTTPSNMTNTTDNYPMGGTEYVIGPTTLPTTNDTFGQYDSAPRAMPELTMLAIPDNGTSEMRWRDSGMASSASESTYSTPSDNTRHPQFPIRTSSEDWINSVPSFQTASNDLRSTSIENGAFSVPFTYTSSPPQIYQPVFGDMGLPLPGYAEGDTFSGADQIPTSTVRSMSPSLAVAQSETLVAIPSIPSGRIFGLSGCGSQPPDGGSLLNTELPVSLNAAASEAVPEYLKVYWDKVHPNYPIIHKHTFGKATVAAAEHIEVLRYAMAAVATQYLADKDDRMKGAQLHAYAWQKSKLFTQADEWPLPVKQTVLLCEYYARFRGRKSQSYKPSPRFTSLYHRVVGGQNKSAPFLSTRDTQRAWKTWIETEAHRRLVGACFLLDVHSSRYHEGQHVSATGLDYSSPSTLPIPLTGDTTQLWEAKDAQSWAKTRTKKSPKTLCNTNLGTLAASNIATAPPFDASILLAAYSLFLSPLQSPTQASPMDNLKGIQTETAPISKLFHGSAVANTYLALQYTPLYCLLSVTGESWAFNKKVPEVSAYAEHQKVVEQWRRSDISAIAVVFAARALKAFLSLGAQSNQAEESKAEETRRKTVPWTDISDYWGVYVCALICWAFSRTDDRDRSNTPVSRETATQWILAASDMEPADVQSQAQRCEARGAVKLAREALAADCLGGRNIMFEDAVGVLKQLEGKSVG
ncbi:hypothetical protein NW759_011857 [Fusarium solani]|nr:hypothetical protein NW759_011857 [Fusarium solani]